MELSQFLCLVLVFSLEVFHSPLQGSSLRVDGTCIGHRVRDLRVLLEDLSHVRNQAPYVIPDCWGTAVFSRATPDFGRHS